MRYVLFISETNDVMLVTNIITFQVSIASNHYYEIQASNFSGKMVSIHSAGEDASNT